MSFTEQIADVRTEMPVFTKGKTDTEIIEYALGFLAINGELREQEAEEEEGEERVTAFQSLLGGN